MLILYDTSILIAGSVASHPKHDLGLQWLQKAKSNKVKMFVSSHSIAEYYAVLTRLPLSPKISPEAAQYLIEENIQKISTIITLTAQDYIQVIHQMAALKLTGGMTYDAIIVKAALKAKVNKILTLNSKDFALLSPDPLSFILSP